MSAFGTEKFQTTSLRLGMPTAFQNAYSKLGVMPRFAPDAPLPSVNITVGDDFQADWHKQKMADAHHMVRAKVHSTTQMYNRANSAPNNSPGHQQPVLGQRQFANPAYGALQSGNPSREDYSNAPWHFSDAHGGSAAGGSMSGGSDGRLVGGVLRSAQGQAYGMSLLQKRIGDFNRIDAMAEQYMGIGPMVNGEEAETGALGADIIPLKNYSRRSQGVSQFAGEQPQPNQNLATLQNVELSQILQNVVDSIGTGEDEDTGVGRLTVSDSVRAFGLIVRLATTSGGEDLSDVLEYLDGTSAEDGIIPKLRALSQRPIAPASVKNQEIYLSLLEFWERVKVYLTKMVATVGMPYKNRVAASQAYIKSLNFTKLFKGRLPEEFIERQDAQEARNIRRGAHFPGPGPGAPRPPDDDDDEGRPPPGGRGRGRPITREDTQHGYVGPGDAKFDGDDRQRFGYASGEWRTGGRPVGYAGEEAPEYGEAPVMGTEEQEEGAEEYEARALGTNPGNDGPRLTSMKSPITGEWDIARQMRSPPSGLARRKAAEKTPPQSSSEEEAPPAPAAAPAAAAPRGLPSFLQSRRSLPSTIVGYQRLASMLNDYYGNSLPDGRGPITVNSYSKVPNVRKNFVQRLNLPS